MEFRDSGSCAVRYIDGLSGHTTSLEAMKSFCMSQVASRKNHFGGGVIYGHTGIKNHPTYALYVFNGATDKGSTMYGDKFADFIEKNKLGEVVRSMKVLNIPYHKNTLNQVYVWAPNQKALQTWWKKHSPKKKEV